VIETTDPQPGTSGEARSGGGGGGTESESLTNISSSTAWVPTTAVVDSPTAAGQGTLRQALGRRIESERLRGCSAVTDERTQVDKLAWCREQMTCVTKEHTSAVGSLQRESKRLAECQSKLTWYVQRRMVSSFEEPTNRYGGGASIFGPAAAEQGAASEHLDSRLAAAAASGTAEISSRDVSHVSPEDAASLRNLALVTLEQSYRHATLKIDHPTAGAGILGVSGIESGAEGIHSGTSVKNAADDIQAHMATLAQQIALGAAAARAKDEAEEAVYRAIRDRQQVAVDIMRRKVSDYASELKSWNVQAARVLWRLGYARARIKNAATRAQRFECARDREDAVANKMSAAADWARRAANAAGEREAMAEEVADAVIPTGRMLRLMGAAFVGVAVGGGILLCAYDALGSGAAAAASAAAAVGTLGLEQGRAVHAESERNRVARELPTVAALVTAQHAAAASGSETVAVEPAIRQITDRIMAKSKGKDLEVLKQLSALVSSLIDKYEDLSPLRDIAMQGMSLEEAMEELKTLLNKELMMMQRVVVSSWEQNKTDLEEHGSKKAERIEKLVEATSAGITALVTDKIDATAVKLDATGSKLRDAIVELVYSELRDMRSEAAVSWASIVQAMGPTQQGVASLDGSQRDMRSDVTVSWSGIMQSVSQMEKSITESDHGIELTTGLKSIADKIGAMQSDVSVSWGTVIQAIEQMNKPPADSDQSVEIKTTLAAIADQVVSLHREMKSDVGASRSIMQAIRQVETAISETDHGIGLKSELKTIADKIGAVQSDVIVSGGTVTQAIELMDKSLANSDRELKALHELQQVLAESQRRAEEKLAALSALDGVTAKVDAMTESNETMRSELKVSWSTIVQCVRQMQKSLSNIHDYSLNDSNLVALQNLAESIKRLETQIADRLDIAPTPPPPMVIGAVDNPYFDEDINNRLAKEKRTLDAIAELKVTLDGLVAKAAMSTTPAAAAANPINPTATISIDKDTRKMLTNDVRQALEAMIGELKAALVAATAPAATHREEGADGKGRSSVDGKEDADGKGGGSVDGKEDADGKDGANGKDGADGKNLHATAFAAVAVADAMQPALDRLERAAAAATTTGDNLGSSVSELGSMLEDIRRLLDGTTAAPPAALEAKIDLVAMMLQELQLTQPERDQRKRSANLLSTFLWRKVRERTAVESFYDALIEAERDPTAQTSVERQFARIYKFQNTIPTHDAKTGGKLEQAERIRMWKNSKLGLVRQIAAKDRKGPPTNRKIPLVVNETNMMKAIEDMQPAAQAKANMSLGLNTTGNDFKLAMKTVADMCEVHDVQLDAVEGVTSENVLMLIDRLPMDVQEEAMQALTSKRIGGASSRVLVRQDTIETITKPGLKATKSVKLRVVTPVSRSKSSLLTPEL